MPLIKIEDFNTLIDNIFFGQAVKKKKKVEAYEKLVKYQ